MKINEIMHPNRTQRFFLHESVRMLLEAYTDPDNELSITFETSKVDPRTHYAYVHDASSGDALVQVVVTFDPNNELNVGNIIPITGNKLVHTSMGSQNNGADMGLRAIRWLYRKIKDFASTQGFEFDRITSSTRYTGARAKNNQGDIDGMPLSFDVSRPIAEVITYLCNEDSITRKIL